jgi:2-polyprenyl-3-methyl-5-hydroxy-6-metoxy-1,4-benzoquinol methylase
VERSVAQFYDDLAEDYHLLFADWKASLSWQADVLERVIWEHLGPGPRSVLDCTCGIGTQAIGLAARGFAVHASDISPAAIARAEREAAALGVSLTTGVADLRTLDRQVPGEFAVVLSCDNALPHLPSDADLLRAARALWSKTARAGGGSCFRSGIGPTTAGPTRSTCSSSANTVGTGRLGIGPPTTEPCSAMN